MSNFCRTHLDFVLGVRLKITIGAIKRDFFGLILLGCDVSLSIYAISRQNRMGGGSIAVHLMLGGVDVIVEILTFKLWAMTIAGFVGGKKLKSAFSFQQFNIE